MARISTYNQDDSLNKLDKVLGTDNGTGATKNYTIESLAETMNEEGLVKVFDGALFSFQDYIDPASDPQGVINFNEGVASAVQYGNINTIYISVNDAQGTFLADYLSNADNDFIKINKRDDLNNFGVYRISSITQTDPAYRTLTVVPAASSGACTPGDKLFLSNFSATFETQLSQHSVTELNDVTNAGSGQIITTTERLQVQAAAQYGLQHQDVIDNLSSILTDLPLSANQGRVLNEAITAINTLLTSDNVNLDELQEVVDFIEANRDSLDNLAISNISGLSDALDSKEPKVEGKGLSTNDFTGLLLTKLNNIADNAEVNVQSNWAETDANQDSFILNKPSDVTNLNIHNVVELADVNDAGSGSIITGAERTKLTNISSTGSGSVITAAERTKLTNIDVDVPGRTVTDGTDTIVIPPSNAEQNVQADWNAIEGDALILNKPALAPSDAEQNVQADWNNSVSTDDAFILNKPSDVTNLGLHNATELNDISSAGSGEIISDIERTKLTGIATGAEVNVQADWNETVATSDAYIQNKPALAPSNAEQNVQADWTEDITTSDAFIQNKPADVTDLSLHSVTDLDDVTNAGSGAIITTIERQKLAGIAINAEENVRANWDVTDGNSDAFIVNKPTDVTDLAQHNATELSDISNAGSGSIITDTERNKLTGIASNAEVNVNADWNATSGDAQILNKPALAPSNAEQNVQADWTEISTASDSFILNKPTNLVTNDRTIRVQGTANEVVVSPDTAQDLSVDRSVTIGLPNDVAVTNNLTVGDTIKLSNTQATTPTFDNGVYYKTEDGHDTLHFRYDGHDLSIDHLTENIPTGILNGGVLSKANSTQFTIAAGDGVINVLNKSNSDPHPEIVKVEWSQGTYTVAGLDANDTDQLNSWIYIDSTGTIQQQATPLTDAQKRSNLLIGSAIHSEGVLKFVKTFPLTGYNNMSQVSEFIQTFGAMKKSGHQLSANGANLSIDRSNGVAFALGRNYAIDPLNPSTVTDAAKTQCTIHRYYGDGSTGFVLDDGPAGAGYTTIDPTKYDNGSGTLANVTGGHYSVQRFYYFPGTPDIVVAYYGHAEYNSMDTAETNYNKEDFIEANNTAEQAIYLGAIVVKGGATALSNSAEAKFLTAGIFRSLAAVNVGGGISSDVLNDLTDVNIQGPSNDDVLRYNASTQQFENVSDSVLPITLDTVNNRVGINNTTPLTALDVNGDIQAYGTSPRIVLKETGSNDDYSLKVHSNGRLAFENNNTAAETMTLLQNGYLGIGTSTPSRKFTVSGNGNIASFQHSSATSYAEAEFVNDSSQRLVLGSIGSQYSNPDWAGMRYLYSTSGDLAIKTHSNLRLFTGGLNLASEQVRITSNGNVGFGTTNPHYYNTYKHLTIDGSAGAGYMLRNNGSNAYEHYANSTQIIHYGLGNRTQDWYTNGQKRMTLAADGDLSIGTTDSPARLTVYADAGQATTLSDSISNSAVYINADATNGSNNLRIGESGSGSYFMQVSNSTGTTPYDINLNPFGGDVGIGTVTPESKLHVEGELKLVSNNRHKLYSSTNGASAGFEFSDEVPAYGQKGYIDYVHSDAASYGSGNAFLISSTESTLSFAVDGKILYNEGIYAFPSSGTGAGIRKDTNWDTAYSWGNHSTAGYLTGSSSAIALGENNAIDFGASKLQWMDQSGAGGTGLDGATVPNPTNEWYHHIIQNHGNNGGYYVNIASAFHSDAIYFQRMVNGSLQGYRRLWHDGDASITIADKIIHKNDTDTYFGFTSDNTMSLFAAGEEMIKATSSIVIVNEAGGNNDFRVKSNGNANMLFVDGGSNMVGIGTSTPDHTLKVIGDIRATTNITAANTIGNKGTDRGINFEAPTTALQTARVDSQRFRFYFGGTGGIGETVSFNNDGKVGIGTYTPDVRLEVIDPSPSNGIIADFVNSTNAGGTTAAIKLSNADAETCDVVLGANRVGANYGSDFFISLSDDIDGTNRERLRIKENGAYVINEQRGLAVRSIDESNYFSFNDESTTADFEQQLPQTGGGGSVAKVDDPTAPAVGCFEITGAYNSDNHFENRYAKVDINAEYTWEMYVKFVSGTDTDQRVYLGWQMYDENKSSFGNTSRYWGALGVQVDADSSNSDWVLLRGTISGVGTAYGQFLSGTEYVAPLVLLNYGQNTNVIRVCGIRLYKSSQNSSKIHLGRVGAESSSVFNPNNAYPANRVTLQNSGSDGLRVRNDHGYIEIGSLNNGHAHIITDRSNFYFSKRLLVDEGVISSYDEDLNLQTASTTRITVKNDTGRVGIGTTAPTERLTVAGNITTDSGYDRNIRANFSDGSYTELRGYGLQFSRVSSYIRPVTNNTQNLLVGYNSSNINWYSIINDVSNNFTVNLLGVEKFKVVSEYIKIPSSTTASGEVGALRFNSTESKFEGHNGTEWAEIAGGGDYSPLTVTKDGSNNFTFSFADATNFKLNCTGNWAFNPTVVSDDVGKSGVIIINNTGTTNPLALPAIFKTPNGDNIAWETDSGDVAIVSYFVVSTSIVLINYVGNFS